LITTCGCGWSRTISAFASPTASDSLRPVHINAGERVLQIQSIFRADKIEDCFDGGENPNDRASRQTLSARLGWCGLVDNAGVPEPCVIRCGPNGFQNLTADHVPGARDLKANTEIIYCAQEWNDELYIGLYNLNSSKNSGGEIWSFSNTSGWSLSAGRGVRGTWDHRYSDSVLDLEVHNDHLIASLIRKYNTPAEFSSVWKLADSHWLPVELGRSDPDLINATHFNCLKSINGDLYCGVGSVFSASYIPSTTGVPTVWQVRDTGGWEALVGDGSNGEWESWNFSRPKGVACPYVYSMTAHSGGIVFGTTSRAGGGQSQIWRIDEL
jgi:hypothetical protein